MLTTPDIKHPEAFALIWPDAIRYAKDTLLDSYCSRGGLTKKKTQKQKTIEWAEFAVIVEVIWRLSGDVYTPHYWHMEIIKEAAQ